MTTLETIKQIENLIIENGSYAVLRPQSLYTNVDWGFISDYFKTDEIHGYTMIDKIIITI